MENKVRRDWLIKLADGLKTLDKSEFKYEDYVSKTDENGCGTVCSALGWLPRFVPESNVIWINGCIRRVEDNRLIHIHPWNIFNITFEWSEFMFLGGDEPNGDNDIEYFGNGYESSLEQVIRRIEHGADNANSYTGWLNDRAAADEAMIWD